jgi:LPS-assembly protein
VHPQVILAYLLATLLCGLGIPAASAQSNPWRLCPPTAPAPALPAVNGPAGTTLLRGDSAQIRNKTLFTVRGAAQIERGSQQLLADLLSYDKPKGQVEAQGNVRFRQDGLVVTGHSAYYDLLAKRGRLQDSTFRLAERHARGAATEVVLDGDVVRLQDASLTTCNDGNHDWYLRAKTLKLDQTTSTGQAWHALLEFKGMPVLYSPYISFPLNNERRSGFLPPRFGSSKKTGADIAIPYYWNIAPNQDATITPQVMAKRGLMLRGDYRYLEPSYHGQLDFEFVPYDPVFGASRGLVSLRHVGDLAPRLHTDIAAAYASDQTYFQDFGNDLSQANTAFLERRGDLTYNGSFWSAFGRLQDYQTIDQTVAPSDRPYARVPQIVFQANPRPTSWPFQPGVRAELVHFERDVGVTGQRIDLQPTLQLPWVSQGWYLKPSVKLWSTNYFLGNNSGPGGSQPSRTLPVVSLDGGAFFDRPQQWLGHALVQTLEPRLYYLYVPFRNQNDLPNFDSEERDLNFAQLFQDNRFTGADRIENANQLSWALTTRFLDRQTGAEQLRASIGQIEYFTDPLVTLPGQPIPTESSSDLIAELGANMAPQWSGRFTMQWNPSANQLEKAGVNVHYEPAAGKIVNVGYRFINQNLDQTDLSVLWPITDRWTVIGRWNYSIFDGRTLETVLGVGYESCCWGLRIAGRRFVNNVEQGTTNDSVFVELELKGLTRFGSRIEDLLERGILGYDSGK